jgi:capsular polysaccharide biosynthesis protein/Mrp family chromosome partitioning ATPase
MRRNQRSRQRRERLEPTGFIPLARRWWPLLLFVACVSAVTAYIGSSRVTPTYEAEVRLLTGPVNADFDTVRASSQLARTYAELATSRQILEAVRTQLDLRQSLDDLVESVTATGNDITRIVSIRARSDRADLAAEIANTIATRLASQTAGAGGAAAGQLTVVDSASPPQDPVEPRVELNTILAAIAGVIGAAVLVLLLPFGRDTIDSEADVADASVPILGSVDSLRPGSRGPSPLVVEARPDSRAANEYRVLATKIELSHESGGPRSVLVAGCEEGDGSGLVAANVAAALAESGSRVTLVDANSLQEEITKVLGLSGRPGYGDLVARGVSETGADENAIRLTAKNGNLAILPSGTERGTRVLETDPVVRLLDRLLRQSDLVVVNTPAVEVSSTTLVWALATDATVLVAQQGRTKREDLREAVKTLSLVDANVIGTVLAMKRPLWRRLPARGRTPRVNPSNEDGFERR